MSEKKAPYGSEPPLENKALTEEEKKLIKTLREENKDIPTNATTSEHTLVRYVRGYAREKEPEKVTKEKYTAMIKWREEKKIDEVILKNPTDWETYNKVYKAFIYGRDKLGRPVCIEQLGKLEPKELLDFGFEKLEAGHIRFMEELTKLKAEISEEKKQMIYKHVHIIDLDGFGYKHVSSKFYGTIKKIMAIDSQFYPETLQKLFILNSSYTFRILWNMFSPLVHKETRARISMLGYDKKSNLEEIKKFVDVEQIPEYLGGKNKAPLAGICSIQFKDIDYTVSPPVWKADSKDPRALVKPATETKTEAKETEKKSEPKKETATEGGEPEAAATT
eukprot:CAMPEP_0167756114 /NCGR_PEP_ID=MMETSP0110_2-20121227/9202_1 /TAXON_ID=629695 /ORGANISM="Gymnochlora sp., Strain CCMP2014" /LENGTH=333 /DNA_ID=CAMNT_0007642181 /DNA_START=467 /DNA_END=1468 /DNA_ORIENTATION=-